MKRQVETDAGKTSSASLGEARAVADGLMLLYSCNVQPRDEYFRMIGSMHRELHALLVRLSEELAPRLGCKEFDSLLAEIRKMGRGMHWVPYLLVLRRKAPRHVVRERGIRLLARIDAVLAEAATA